ncbi:MAG: peptide deformylase [Congregibacter sp.]
MTVLTVLEHPDETLRRSSKAVTAFNDSLSSFVTDLFDTLKHSGGIGMSAPQLGRLERILVVSVPDDQYGPQVYINPELLKSSRRGLVEESCLSVPGVVGNVLRATRIRIRASDQHGVSFERELDGMHAVCLQHEMDHLNGKLFIDRLSWFKKLRLRLAGSTVFDNQDHHAA